MLLETCTKLVSRWQYGRWKSTMPLLLFVSTAGLSLDYRILSEKQGFFCLAGNDQPIVLFGIFSCAAQLWFWIRALKRITRACIGYLLL